jgi:MFS family permease
MSLEQPAAPDTLGDTPSPPVRRWYLDTFRALRHRNYRLYFLGQIVSLTGSWVQTPALIWLAYELSHRQSTWAALVSAAQVVPTVLLGVYGGSLADRWPRRTLIFLTQAAFLVLALILTGMVVGNVATPIWLLVVSLLIGIVNAFDTPARLAFVIDLVGREDLVNAVALNSLVFNVARFAGPALSAGVFGAAAWVVPTLGGTAPGLWAASGCFLINGLTFVAVLAALLSMRLPSRPLTAPEKREASNLRDAFRYLGQRRKLVLLVILAGAMAFFGWPVLSLLPALSESLPASFVEDLRLAAALSYALMLGAIGGGALIGALLVASFGTVSRRGLFLFGGVLVGGMSLLALGRAPALGVAVVWCALSGCGLILFFATGQAMMQLGADEHNRGRIMGIWLMVLSAANPAGHLLAGKAADAWGVPVVLELLGTGIALAGAGVGLVALLGRR